MKLNLKYQFIPFALILLFASLKSSSQGERDYWYFGLKAGMKFDGDYAQVLADNTIERNIAFGVIEGPDNIICASNEDGEIMFYSDGRKFRNRLHQNMLNSPTGEYSVYYSQAAISRYPENDNKFYVFITIQDGLKNYLTYTIVDMSLDNGLGGLDPNNTHVIITNDIGKQMVIARHANGKDSWLICLRRGTYYAYLITKNGISSTPVVSNEGVSFIDGPLSIYGTLTVSPDNELIASAFPGLKKLHLLTFNDLTGKLKFIYEYIDEDDELGDEPNASVEFSENSKVLYYSGNLTGIRQFDITNINNVPNPINITPNGFYPYMRRGPNGQIYSIQIGNEFIGAIQDPNTIGLGCLYSRNVLGLIGSNLFDLPVFLQPKFPDGISHINICEGETTEINFVGSFRESVRIDWILGDGTISSGENISHSYLNPGTYIVTANVVNNDNNEIIFTDTEEITIYDSPELNDLDNIYLCSEDTTIYFVNMNEQVLNGQNPNTFNTKYYFSLTDAELRSNEVQEYIPEIGTKTIWVRVENKVSPACYDITSFDIVTPEYITIDIDTEQYLCDTKNGLELVAPDGFITYSWSNGENSQNITVHSTGRYTLTVQKGFGDFICEAQSTVVVLEGDELPIVEEIKVLDWSQNHNSIEVVIDRIGNYEFSVDGINYQESPIFLNLPINDYYVYVRDSRCLQEIISEKLFLLYYNKFFTPDGNGINDYWQVINANREENIEISIYNRYGKFLSELGYSDRGWDGKFNGIDMPSSDYWFRVTRENGDVYYGHFTLKR